MGETISDISSSLVRIENDLGGIEDRLDAVEKQLDEPSADEQELANRVFEALPTETQLNQEQQSAFGESPAVIEGPGDTQIVQTGSINDLAEYLDEPRIHVRQAVENLEEDTGLIGTATKEGEKRYFKVV